MKMQLMYVILFTNIYGGKTQFMKEQLYTIPLIDAFSSQDECPFCYIERTLEENAINFILGSGASYMEKDIRSETDDIGFCRNHFKKMYDYGNRLGCALILSTHIKKKNQELQQEIKQYKPRKISPLTRLKKTSNKASSLTDWITKQNNHCFICDYYENTFHRYIDTFFQLYKKDTQFEDLIKTSKGFCIPHFGVLIQEAEVRFSEKEIGIFFDMISKIMLDNMKRVEGDIMWFCDKFDYRNANADWKNSKDAIQRTMQKLKSGYPAALPYTQDK